MNNSEKAIQTINKLRTGVKEVIKGRDDTIDLVLCALIADGHVLLEDYPGSGKTMLTKTLGGLISSTAREDIAPFKRVQFTPDLLPGDVLGVNIFDPQKGNFNFIRGPIFAHIVLADEINRTGPKVQSAFLECMAEKQVTLDNVTYELDDLFFVIGTQNPLDLAGTYPLPLVQLDRFLLKIPMTYVDSESELEILLKHNEIEKAVKDVTPVCTRDEILEARKAAKSVNVSENISKAIVQIVQATRDSNILQFGASTRAAIMLQKSVRAWALLEGRDYVTEDDLKHIAPYALLHRLKFHAGAGDNYKALEELTSPALENLIRAGA